MIFLNSIFNFHQQLGERRSTPFARWRCNIWRLHSNKWKCKFPLEFGDYLLAKTTFRSGLLERDDSVDNEHRHSPIPVLVPRNRRLEVCRFWWRPDSSHAVFLSVIIIGPPEERIKRLAAVVRDPSHRWTGNETGRDTQKSGAAWFHRI